MEPEAQELFSRYLKKRGLRNTPERRSIITEIFASHDHFDVEELYFRLRNKDVKVSKASIYRALPLLIDSGLIREVYHQDGHHHYEHILGHSHHCHLFCTVCDEVVEFTDERLDRLEEELGERFGFDISGHRLEVYGVCPKCGGKV